MAGAASVGLFFEVIYRWRPDKIGFGDVRLIIVNGLLAAWWGLGWAWWALCAGALAEWPIAIVAVIRHGRTATVRWAPGLGRGTAAVLTFGVDGLPLTPAVLIDRSVTARLGCGGSRFCWTVLRGDLPLAPRQDRFRRMCGSSSSTACWPPGGVLDGPGGPLCAGALAEWPIASSR